jgi:hypothetical protein
MLTRVITIIAAICLLFLSPADGFSQDDPDVIERTKYGVGFQGSFPASGLSGMLDLTDEFTAQAIVGFFGNLNTFAGRGLYKFQREDFWNLYGYGMLGAWHYSIGSLSETVLGFGLGAGVEYDWRAFNSELPPIFFNLELGIGFVDFDKVPFNFSTLMIGAGLHYRF